MTARWKELCMDTTGGEELGRFYAGLLGLTFEPDDEDGCVVDAPGGAGEPDEGRGIAMCRVPEPKTVKHRVHLDVYAASVEEVVERGARVVLPAEESGFAWTVMTDPEGGEFCVFVREPDRLPDYRMYALIVDAADPEAIAQWWAERFGAEVSRDDKQGSWRWLEAVPGMPFEGIVFIDVPEPKTVKNRIHWDVYATFAEMEAAGATLLRERDDEISWTVMADPEGNEFCVFEPR